MAAAVASPSVELLVRDLEGFSIWTGPPFDNGQPKIKIPKVPCSSATFSEDGSRLMVIKPDGVISIFDCKTYKEIRSIQVPNFAAANISPRGTYLQTFQKQASPQEKNVTSWSVENGSCVHNFSQKNMSKTSWPSIRFSSDEAVACRLVTNEIQFFDSADLSKGFVSRLRVPGVAAVQLSKMPGSHVATFVPESKGVPASVQIFACGSDPSSQPLARRSFFRCSTVQLHWNYGSTGLLAVAQADVDKTNQSYYGESKLSYLTTDGAHEGLVPLRKEGPIHDVQWSYTGTEFAVVYGFMPAKATVFDKKCNPLLELGSGPYNTIKWNPKGRFLCLAGFGNLPGDMAFWDCTEKKQLGTTKAEWSVVSEWSPNGCFFMTASTAPRRQIDNGIKIFHHNGSLYFKKMFDKLFQADWKPESADRFGDISELVKSIGSLKIEETKAQGQGSKPSQNATKSNPVNPPQKSAAYLPPSARKAASVKAELFGGLDTQEMSKNALKNKKKREKQREKKAAEGASSGSNP
ncbi:eukaryotic translation initiation factor 2A-like [Chenopodium quinoa]|uniref:eukaryotic translation initiation factor 2A-like n=1 Tax=Chenopodium quinoa TaxID=63459 RepID=UPI000B794972|nr:eukaryotic translation initiation factor 2A-like [Chenopodium quinoa]XP_021751809.1 eukaryotic translation initiation factor 2A-like [Chenopodium quinoa]